MMYKNRKRYKGKYRKSVKHKNLIVNEYQID